MISLGRRDARKELGLGLGFGVVREMEDTELEEGEACSYHNHNDDDCDSSVDPDIDLSYIGEKLQHLLGHFQKDFEGGVSAENLGAKFGGYGSFLPTYQRSPVWSHPRTPPNNQHSASRSPANFHLEGGPVSYVCSSMAPQSTKSEATSTSTLLQPVSKSSSSLHDSVKKEASMPSTFQAENFSIIHESRNRKPANLPDQKKLKVRIKVGCDNLSTRKNAAIYSGLGLDVSPSSSLDDSPSESEGMSHEPQDSPFESPAQILLKMTSSPLPGSQLLSPLPDDLIHLKEKEKRPKDIGMNGLRQARESSDIGMNGSDSLKVHRKASRDKKVKSLNVSEIASCRNDLDSQSSFDGIPHKDRGVDSLTCEELVTNTLNLPLLRDRGSSDQTREETLEPIFTQEDGWFENRNASIVSKGRTGKNDNFSDSVSVNTRSDGHCKGERPKTSGKVGSNALKGRKHQTSEAKDHSKQKANNKAKSLGHEPKSHFGKVSSSSEGKVKTKKSQSHDNVEVSPSLAAKTKKSTYMDKHTTDGELGELKLPKNSEKTGDMYRAFFGDMEIEQEENQISPLEAGYEDRMKESNLVELGMHGTQMVKGRSSGKKIQKPSAPEAYPRAASSVGPHPGNGPISDVPHATTAPVLIQENWVCCDKCQQWRLLPIGKNPNDLPEKWVCSMLNWLPGMNRCSFTEEETTNALIARYQVPAPESQTFMQSNPGVVASGEIHPDYNGHVNGLNAVGSGEKSSLNRDGSSQLVKKSVRSNDVNRSSLVNEADLKLSKFGDIAVEKPKHKQKEKNKKLDSDGGNPKVSKMKGKRDHDPESFRASKKIRTEGVVEQFQHGRISDKGGDSLSNCLPSVSSGKSMPKHNNHKDTKHSRKEQVQLSSKRVRDTDDNLHDGQIDIVACDSRDSSKRKKMKESHNQLQDSRILAKEFSENDQRKETAHASEGKESSASKNGGKTGRKGSHGKTKRLIQEPGSTLSQISLDGGDSSRRNSASLHRAVAATSSSSKVSGSHKTKAYVHDVKGSPVESVSSLPVRVSKLDNLTSERKGLIKKEDDFADTGLLDKVTGCSGPNMRCQIESSLDQFHADERQNETQGNQSVSHSRKGFSSLSRDKNRNSNSESGNGNAKFLDSVGKQAPPCEVRPTGKKQIAEKGGIKSNEDENACTDTKGSLSMIDNCKKDIRSNSEGHVDPDIKVNSICIYDATSTPKQSMLADCEISGRGKALSSTPPRGAQNETLANCNQLVCGPQKGNGQNGLSGNADNALKLSQQIKRADHPNGIHYDNSRNSMSNGHRSRDLEAASPVKRDSSSQAANNAVKEATNLKHMADRLKKNSGSQPEVMRLYFEAALKFLDGAALFESCNIETAKSAEMIQSMQIYGSTAKLCEFCAHEYEKLEDMAAAALAYKCMEVAYMRVVISSYGNANRDQHELQKALQKIPPGESPSSSASDIDNLNHTTSVDKVPVAKGVSSPQVNGSHLITAKIRPSLARLLNFTQDVSSAMEASRKSQIAFAAANARTADAQSGDGMFSIRTALDFSFQDVEGLLRLVRLALEAINR
ncbi:hypothetical protein K2173_007243 [Erythroxylum novogranatense]|uniref:CW-type domain-containing protein n=1 Tax=Erythroxylum novogranatense TaxID=1862640 RepID=A0AAV8U8R4_9ROSI|nr:hypothetical protein K2173_007243 [Erythroxylum novogranatense]